MPSRVDLTSIAGHFHPVSSLMSGYGRSKIPPPVGKSPDPLNPLLGVCTFRHGFLNPFEEKL